MRKVIIVSIVLFLGTVGLISIGGADVTGICSYYCDTVPSHLQAKTPSEGVKQYLEAISSGNKASAPAEFEAKSVSDEIKAYNKAVAAGEKHDTPEALKAKKISQHECNNDNSCEMMSKGIKDCLLKS